MVQWPVDHERGKLRLRRKLAEIRPELVAFAHSLTLDGAAAEDLAQNAILRALQSGSAPGEISDLRPWMFRVIKNLHIDDMRKLKVQREYSIAQSRLLENEPLRSGDPVETVLVRQAFSELSSKEREILCLVDILGLTYAETAATLEIPQGTVMSRVSRARRAMIDRMGDSNIRPLKRRNG